MKNVIETNAKLAEIPAGKWTRKIQRTVAGLVFVALAVWGAKADWHEYLVIGLAVLGATTWAGEIVLHPLKLVLALGKDARAVILGNGGNGPPPPAAHA